MPKKSVTVQVPDFSRVTKKLFGKNYAPLLVVLLIVASFLLGVLFTKVQYLENGGITAPSGTGTDTATAPAAPTGPVDVSLGHLPPQGDENADIKIVEFADFQCPFCDQWFKEVGPNLIKDYVDTGKAVFAFRHYAFLGQESTDSAVASECANEQGKFWEYHDYLYDHQAGENQGAFSKENLKKFAADMGLDTASFNSCLDSDKYADKVSQDVSEGSTAGVSGTPATFINGRQISGACPYTTFQDAIKAEMDGKDWSVNNCSLQVQ